jgi:hypothetical protein
MGSEKYKLQSTNGWLASPRTSFFVPHTFIFKIIVTGVTVTGVAENRQNAKCKVQNAEHPDISIDEYEIYE